MKKLLALLLAAMFTLSLAACSGNKTTEDDKSSDSSSSSDPSSEDNAEADAETVADSALDLLTNVWNSYNEDDKFAVVGGDFDEENMKDGEPGLFGIEDANVLDTTLAFPAASADKIDGAAAIRHMMNANTFTCGAYHVKDAADIADVTAAIKENIQTRQWLCGFPERMLIITVGDYIVSAFGAEDLINTFKTNLTAVYASAETVCAEAVM